MEPLGTAIKLATKPISKEGSVGLTKAYAKEKEKIDCVKFQNILRVTYHYDTIITLGHSRHQL